MVGSYGLGVWLHFGDSTGIAALSLNTSSFRRASLLRQSPARAVIEACGALAKAAGVPGIPIFESLAVGMMTEFTATSAQSCALLNPYTPSRKVRMDPGGVLR